MNRIFLQCQENYFNHKLKVTGHVFLNEVYDALGFERTREGAAMGWMVGDDKFIDFGIAEQHDISGEKHILLNFNIDGVIVDNLKEEASL